MHPADNKSEPALYPQEALLDYEKKYSMLLEAVRVGVFSLCPGPDFLISSSNRVLVEMLGYDAEAELDGTPVRELFDTREEWDRLAVDLAAGGAVRGREVSLKRRDGFDIRVAISAQAHRLSDGSPGWIDCLFKDVTEDRVFEMEMQYHESELNRYALALSQANKKLNMLSSITRHDILNQLTAIGVYLELIKSDVTDPNILEYITIEEKVLENIVKQIQFTKDYEKIGVSSPQWHNVRKTILSAAATLPLAQETLVVTSDYLFIYADPLLEKVFYNLVENALRYGRGLSHITFSQVTSGDGIVVLCEDDGGGIPAEHKEGIFNHQHFKEAGFGLFLSREILGITSLSIRETGEPGHGARFEIAVPRGYFRFGQELP